MTRFRDVDEFLALDKKGVVDYNNPGCSDCNDCCGALSYISNEEYTRLKKFFTKDKLGKKIYQSALNRVLTKTKELDALYLVCPLSNGLKRCDIYPMRPAICRDFHCSKELNKVVDKTSYSGRTILCLFKKDLMKNKDFATKMLHLTIKIK